MKRSVAPQSVLQRVCAETERSLLSFQLGSVVLTVAIALPLTLHWMDIWAASTITFAACGALLIVFTALMRLTVGDGYTRYRLDPRALDPEDEIPEVVWQALGLKDLPAKPVKTFWQRAGEELGI